MANPCLPHRLPRVPDVFLEIVFFRGTRIALWLKENPGALRIPGKEGRTENWLVRVQTVSGDSMEGTRKARR